MTRRLIVLELDPYVTGRECGLCCHAETVADGWRCAAFGRRLNRTAHDTARHDDCIAAEQRAEEDPDHHGRAFLARVETMSAEGSGMTRDEIEADIEVLSTLGGMYGSLGAIDRAIARLRADLARCDGPAEGTERIWISLLQRGEATWTNGGPIITEPTHRLACTVVADVSPIRVVEVQGEVER